MTKLQNRVDAFNRRHGCDIQNMIVTSAITLDTLQAVINEHLDIAKAESDIIVKDLGPEVSIAYWSGKRDALLDLKRWIKVYTIT